MDISHTRSFSNSLPVMRTWNSPCLKYTLITGLALAALALVSIGSIAYAGIQPLNVISDFCSLMMIALGFKVILGGMVLLYFSMTSLVRHGDLAKYNLLLKEREFFVFENDKKQKMISLNDPNSGIQQLEYAHYNQIKKLHTQISLFDLDARG